MSKIFHKMLKPAGQKRLFKNPVIPYILYIDYYACMKNLWKKAV